ncbi:MAG TPA: phosphomannomutase/phosphoglucomutase [Longimicrobiales bacterium]|nr:phosphomannomutase/phosphoglucomutase [Longimicrobiales bacterium]
MKAHPHIFREYDIRGVVGPELDETVAEAVGRALASEAVARAGGRRPLLALGHDNRPSSPGLADGAERGMVAAGADVVRVDTVPTPALYWAVQHFDADGGLQITGSHNPPEYNGFKMVLGGRSLYGDAIQELRRRIAEGDYERGEGSARREDVLDAYVDDVAGRFSARRPVRVVVDCGNGTGSLVAVPLLAALGAEVLPLFCESDGTFPNHHPDPVVDENLEDLIREVRARDADLGVAFDGDADRLGAVDELGGIIRGDILLLLFGVDLLERRPGAQVIFDVKCSRALPEVLAAHGGRPLMWKTGHSLIKEKMTETGALLAGELSGHICFADDYYGFDDAPYAACRLVELVSRSEEPLSERLAAFPHYASSPEIRIEVPEEEKFALVERAVEHFRRDHEVVDVDGARVSFEDGWGLLRASNTQPALVARYEADDEAGLRRIRSVMEGWLRAQGVDPE